MTAVFACVLVANRGEIAVRIGKTLRLLGVRVAAVYTDADAGARHVRTADVAVRVDSYLSVSGVVGAAVAVGADAVHPGYGFLAENAGFARACAETGVVFVGPPAEAIAVMGDKISAKAAVSAAGVPVVPGLSRPGLTDAELVAGAAEVGFPVLVKPSAGGGGKGMHVVSEAGGMADAVTSARREAAASFGDDTLFLERYVQRPRHIEVQVLADAHGAVLHLGERECSLQRRHQKVIEEAPSPLLDAATRDRIGAAAVAIARSVGYVGAGTVEFIVSADAPDEFFFLEMNTRLQVEHPVTELVTGLDLVEWQLRVAAGQRLAVEPAPSGHAVEARVYAEDPAAGFLPTGGPVLVWRSPAGVRVDGAVESGDVVGAAYDPMLAKVTAWAPTRAGALARLDRALADTVVLGLGTNIAFLRALIARPDVVAGRLDTGLIERELDRLTDMTVPQAVYVAWALHRRASLVAEGPWGAADGWRVGGPAETVWQTVDGTEVGVRGNQVRVGDQLQAASLDGATLTVDGVSQPVVVATDGEVTWVHLGGAAYAVRERVADRTAGEANAGDGDIRSPMPGAVVALRASGGETVVAGQGLLVVEAMKMEHTLVAPFDGVLAAVEVREGEQVAVGQLLARVEPA